MMDIYPYEPEALQRMLAQAEAVGTAIDQSGRAARRVHKLLGNPIAVWEDGRVVWIPPEEIAVDDGPVGQTPLEGHGTGLAN